MSELNKLILLITLAFLSGLFGYLIGWFSRGLREIDIRTKHILNRLKPTKVEEKEDSGK